MSGHDQGAGEVHVDVDLDGREASADVHVDREVLPPSAPRAATARAWCALAEEATADGAHGVAATAARRGLEALGDDYLDAADTATVDDTDMNVLGADKVGSPSEEAALLHRALESRLAMYQWRHEEFGLRFDPPVEG